MRTQDARNIHCNEYLSKIGAKFARTQQGTNGLEYVYHSPNRNDTKPSLCVNLDRNIWSDVPVGEGGRLIELVCHTNNLANTNVKEALAILDKLFPEYRGSGGASRQPTTVGQAVASALSIPGIGATGLKKKESDGERLGGHKLISVKEIYRYPLKNYLQERRIPLQIASKYLWEVEYQDDKERTFYALGWPCGSTYGLRNKVFKGFLGQGIEPSIWDTGSDEAFIFEGIFDFLAYLAYTKRKQLPVTAIVLNSTVMAGRLDTWLKANPHVQRLNCYFDNDEAGRSLYHDLKSAHSGRIVSDYGHTYADHKDFAEWFASRST